MLQGILKPKEERRILRGHLWAYRNEFDTLPDLDDGQIVEVLSDKGRLIGRGLYQAAGGIAVRMLTQERKAIDGPFIAHRIDRAKAQRDTLYPQDTTYRWLHGESDGLPGLVADRYGPLVAAKASSTFYDTIAEELAEAFLKHEGVEGFRMTVGGSVRTFGETPSPVTCRVNECTFSVNTESGQKTGLFLDQRENWTLTKPFASEATVFDGHCYTGAWGCHAATYGARSVLGVDTSKPAIENAQENARLNGVEGICRFESADVQEALKGGDQYDIVIIDPPALAKSRGHLKKASGLYQAINRDAIRATRPGGILITSSCSQPLDTAGLLEILKRATTSAQRRAHILHCRGAAPDHPALLSMPETAYLCCVVLRIL